MVWVQCTIYDDDPTQNALQNGKGETKDDNIIEKDYITLL